MKPLLRYVVVTCSFLFFSIFSYADSSAWNTENQGKINQFLTPEVAVFDADGTLWPGDIGEGFLKWLIANKKLKDVDYSQDIYGKYEEICEDDHAKCYAYAVQLMQGLAVKDIQTWAHDFFEKEIKPTIFPMQKVLIQDLEKRGVQVWIVSASGQWLVDQAAETLGISPEHVIGIRTETNNGIITDKIIPPVTYRAGKVEAIQKYIKQRPVLAAGNAMTDYEMLMYAKELSIVINPQKEPLITTAKLFGWFVEHWN